MSLRPFVFLFVVLFGLVGFRWVLFGFVWLLLGPLHSVPWLVSVRFSFWFLGRVGKTLQAISLCWTLLKADHAVANAPSTVRKVLIVAPVSLIANWRREFTKWLGSSRIVPSYAKDVTSAGVRRAINEFQQRSHHVHEGVRAHA